MVKFDKDYVMRYVEQVNSYNLEWSRLCVEEWDLDIGLEQRRPTNPIGGDSHKSQGIGCWSTVNSLQSGLPQHNQVFFP